MVPRSFDLHAVPSHTFPTDSHSSSGLLSLHSNFGLSFQYRPSLLHRSSGVWQLERLRSLAANTPSGQQPYKLEAHPVAAVCTHLGMNGRMGGMRGQMIAIRVHACIRNCADYQCSLSQLSHDQWAPTDATHLYLLSSHFSPASHSGGQFMPHSSFCGTVVPGQHPNVV